MMGRAAGAARARTTTNGGGMGEAHGAAGRVVLALDIGTTSARALVIDASGVVLASAQQEVGLSTPQPGWVEQDADELWAAQVGTARAALEQAGVPASRVAGLGIANQRETTIVWDRETSRSVAPAIVWQDRRTADFCEQLRGAGAEALVRRRTGLLLDPYFSATKLRWLLDNVPGIRERAQAGELAFGTVDSWLVWRLSGGRRHVTDATNASRTLLYDIRAGAWDEELLALFGVPRELLPEIVDSSGVVAETDAALLGAAVPIAGLAGDQQAALFGQACMQRGSIKVTYGTGCFLLLHTGDEPVSAPTGLVSTVALQRGGRRTYALEGSVFVGGAAVQWLRDGLGVVGSGAEATSLAQSVASSDGVVFVPALAGLGAPYWDPHARGGIFGITRGTTAAHLARATLEGIALQVADLYEAEAEGAGVAPAEVRADGGAAASDLLLQFQADLLGVPVTRAAQPEASAFGAAWLAGLATGVWSGDEELAGQWRAGGTFAPAAGPDADESRRRWRAAVAAVRGFARELQESRE
jgi:glycerol kinase